MPDLQTAMSDVTTSDSRAQSLGFADAKSRREFWIVALASLLSSITVTHSTVVALALARENYSLEQIGILISITAVPVLAGALFSGLLTSYIGARSALQLAMLFAALGVSSLAFTREVFWSAFISRIVWGIGVGFFLPPVMVYVQSRLNQKRFVYLVSAFSATIPLGLAIAPVMGEYTLNTFGVSAMFAIGAVPAAIGFLLIFFVRPLSHATKATGLGLRTAAQRWHTVPALALLIGGSHYGYSGSYLAPSLHEQNISLGFFFIPMTIATVGSRVGAMRFLGGFTPRQLASGGLAVSGLSLIVAAMASGPLLTVVAGTLLGLGNSMVYPVISAWMGKGAAAHARPGVQALAATSFYMGVYATPFPETYLVAWFGYTTTEIILGGAGICVALALILGYDKD